MPTKTFFAAVANTTSDTYVAKTGKVTIGCVAGSCEVNWLGITRDLVAQDSYQYAVSPKDKFVITATSAGTTVIVGEELDNG